MMEDNHPESICRRCKGPNVTWCAPSPLWNEVMRNGNINNEDLFGGIVCPVCFAQLAEIMGLASRWRFFAENVTQELTLVTPSGRIWDEDQWLWVNPNAV